MNSQKSDLVTSFQHHNPRARRSSGKRGLPRLPLDGGPERWDFYGPTEQ